MSAFTKILATTALTLAASTASAALITETVSFGTQGSTTDVGLGTLNETLTIAGFNTALGTLTGVNVTVFGQLDSAGFTQNVSGLLGTANNANAQAEIEVTQDWQVSSTATSDFTFQAANQAPFLSESTLSNFSLGNGDTFSYNQSSGLISSVLTASIPAFLAGPVNFDFTGVANTVINKQVDSGIGYFIDSFSTAAWGQVAVEYTYDAVTPPTASVPVPGTLALLGLGLLAMRARKSA